VEQGTANLVTGIHAPILAKPPCLPAYRTYVLLVVHLRIIAAGARYHDVVCIRLGLVFIRWHLALARPAERTARGRRTSSLSDRRNEK
jgi:hypothetical protein